MLTQRAMAMLFTAKLFLIGALLIALTCVPTSRVDAQPPSGDSASYRGKSITQWTELLGDADKDRRRRAAYALGRIGPAAHVASPQLVGMLKDRDLQLVWYAVDALGRIGPRAKAAVPGIVAAIKDKSNDEILRRSAARALGRIGPDAREATPVLLEALRSGDELYRVAAALALWRIEKHRAALPALAAALQSGKREGPYAAATALAAIGPDAAPTRSVLVAALRSVQPDVRRAAAKALGNLGITAAPAVAKALGESPGVDPQAGIAALAYLITHAREQVLNRRNPDGTRLATAGSVLSRDVIGPLVELLDHNRPPVRRAAADALAGIGPLAIAALLAALESKSEHVATSAADALIRMERYLPPEKEMPKHIETYKRNKLVKPLTAALSSENRATRAAAVRIFAALSIGPYGKKEAMPALRRALRDESIATRRFAAKAIRRLEAGE